MGGEGSQGEEACEGEKAIELGRGEARGRRRR
jgi:hypothetical protein